MMQVDPKPLAQPYAYPSSPKSRPTGIIPHGRYRVRFANSLVELDTLLRLRYRIFNLELGEGLESSELTGRDEDEFDRHCHHLLVENADTGSMVGTYRMQTAEMATAGAGFYSAGEFDLSALPQEIVGQSMEIGRACIAREHRNRFVLFLLWKGLARYLTVNDKRYLFGCCSLTSQDPDEGMRVYRYLEAQGHLHPEIEVPPQPGFECVADEAAVDSDEVVEIPALFKTYLRYGAKVCGLPAIDREFKTIDFFVLFDVSALAPRTYQLFFH